MLPKEQRSFHDSLEVRTTGYQLPYWLPQATVDFEHAREMEVRYTSVNLPSSDDITNMGLPQKVERK
ncbi:hypothetical protein EG68_09603 [Paragonimus skrjabini miyazakii]|uniref:Uncharacterized protein n=1 Tax=Paragonimus skrjabini miyazakii TaxID=59628 RepID=A0A8S9YLM1_9TREM|nr:hypothetical protein EG68_09603 [Paragonimus skrjabini miyazakii]